MNHIWVTRNPVAPPASVQQLVWEPVPPYTGVHALDFSVQARYLSTQRGIANWSCMATRGNGWGDYSLREPAAFQQEAAVALAGGGRPYFGDDSYPSGNPDPAVYRVYGEVNRRTAALEPYMKGCTPVHDVAVLHSALTLWSGLAARPANPQADSEGRVAGAHAALAEEHIAFGIVNSDGLIDSLPNYRVLVLPEQSVLTPRECDAIRTFVDRGGALIASGDTGTRDAANQPLSDFALASVLGVKYLGRAEVRRSFIRDAMDVQVNGPYWRVDLTSAQTILPLAPPTGPRQSPPEKPEGPAIALNRFGKGAAVYCATAIFTAYHQDGTVALRQLIARMLNLVHTTRSIVLANAPAHIEVMVQARGRERFVHLVNFGGGRRMGGPQRAREFTPVHGIEVRVRSASRPRKVTLVPELQPRAFEWRDGWTTFRAQPVGIHAVYMIEIAEG
jgi:hypothetical protein